MEILTTLAFLACPAGMGLMMWFMMRGKNGGGRKQHVSTPSASTLRAERLRIDAELARRAADDELAGERA